MTIDIKKITKRELVAVVDSYYTEFPEWTRTGDFTFSRLVGPLAQQIGFESLRSGAYRASSRIRILVAPEAAMLHQFLAVKNREVLLRDHERMQQQVVDAMKEEFSPSINLPLQPVEVASLCEAAATSRSHDAYALAGLNAYLGNSARALYWIEEFESRVLGGDGRAAEWELAQLNFARSLRDAIATGQAQVFLSRILHDELQKLLGRGAQAI